jgi:hypothetical protein
MFRPTCFLWLERETSTSSDSTAATVTKALAPHGDNVDDETRKCDARGEKS